MKASQQNSDNKRIAGLGGVFNRKLCSLQEALSKITIHEELARNPEIAKQIDKEISEGNFLP